MLLWGKKDKLTVVGSRRLVVSLIDVPKVTRWEPERSDDERAGGVDGWTCFRFEGKAADPVAGRSS